MYVVGIRGCGKSTVIKRILEAACAQPLQRIPGIVETQHILNTPRTAKNRYFVFMYKSLAGYDGERLPSEVISRIESLAPYEAIVYDEEQACMFAAPL